MLIYGNGCARKSQNAILYYSTGRMAFQSSIRGIEAFLWFSVFFFAFLIFMPRLAFLCAYVFILGQAKQRGAPCPALCSFRRAAAPAQVRPLARRLLSMRPCADALLLLCDLPDAFSDVMPEDAPLLRALQSAVMAADARCPGHFLLLVRKRVWDDAARLYLGENQPLLPMQTVAALLAHGHAPSAFAAASFSPASLAGQFSAALFCPPTSPARRMFRAACWPHWANPAFWPRASCPRWPTTRRCQTVCRAFFFGIARRVG